MDIPDERLSFIEHQEERSSEFEEIVVLEPHSSPEEEILSPIAPVPEWTRKRMYNNITEL